MRKKKWAQVICYFDTISRLTDVGRIDYICIPSVGVFGKGGRGRKLNAGSEKDFLLNSTVGLLSPQFVAPQNKAAKLTTNGSCFSVHLQRS